MARDRGVELNDHIIGYYAVAVVVHPNSPLTSLTREQVRDIFTGTIKNWKELGGPDAAIHLYIRDPISGTYLGFQEIAMENKPYALEVKTFTSYDAITKAVAQDPHGIGYTSVELAETPAVKGLVIGEAPATFKSVHDGVYPYARLLRFYTAKGRETQLAMQFVEFIQSDKGRVVLEEMGYVPRQ
jgi:phosphate transport system substrate-binding protein